MAMTMAVACAPSRPRGHDRSNATTAGAQSLGEASAPFSDTPYNPQSRIFAATPSSSLQLLGYLANNPAAYSPNHRHHHPQQHGAHHVAGLPVNYHNGSWMSGQHQASSQSALSALQGQGQLSHSEHAPAVPVNHGHYQQHSGAVGGQQRNWFAPLEQYSTVSSANQSAVSNYFPSGSRAWPLPTAYQPPMDNVVVANSGIGTLPHATPHTVGSYGTVASASATSFAPGYHSAQHATYMPVNGQHHLAATSYNGSYQGSTAEYCLPNTSLQHQQAVPATTLHQPMGGGLFHPSEVGSATFEAACTSHQTQPEGYKQEQVPSPLVNRPVPGTSDAATDRKREGASELVHADYGQSSPPQKHEAVNAGSVSKRERNSQQIVENLQEYTDMPWTQPSETLSGQANEVGGVVDNFARPSMAVQASIWDNIPWYGTAQVLPEAHDEEAAENNLNHVQDSLAPNEDAEDAREIFYVAQHYPVHQRTHNNVSGENDLQDWQFVNSGDSSGTDEATTHGHGLPGRSDQPRAPTAIPAGLFRDTTMPDYLVGDLVGVLHQRRSPRLSPRLSQDLSPNARGHERTIRPTGRVGKPRGGVTRGAFSNAHLRYETAETRRRRACIRCRCQKTRCLLDPNDPTGDCLTCKAYNKGSKKTLHRTPCCRHKLTNSTLFRKGGLQLTERWTGTQMRDIPRGDRIDPDDVRTIQWTLGLCDTPMTVRCVKFRPRPGDVTARYWTVLGDDGQEIRMEQQLSPYCLDDIQETANDFEKYVISNAFPAFDKQSTRPLPNVLPEEVSVVEGTYRSAIQYYQDLFTQTPPGKIDPEPLAKEKQLIQDFFTLWFAMRHTTGSSWICGEETLGMEPHTREKSYPLYGKISLPRMILAQFDSITHTRLLDVYGKKVLKELEDLIQKNSKRHVFIIYLVCFIMLREATWISQDRCRHAKENYGNKVQYSLPEFVQSLQGTCNGILHHWHYFQCKPLPDPSIPWSRSASMLTDLPPVYYNIIIKALMEPRVQQQLERWKRDHADDADEDRRLAHLKHADQADWDNPWYWVSQMFIPDWLPHATFKIPKRSIPA
ncbi:hypothetical protein S40285_00095 [Stachybotrys chlorohalonatus IBT 40285]|uniref:Zn(2)-C6 fungal-type domain-containing protein n=1 Tax=Stachybotrys chlorohalonatus (strain IBT 40285) TaxID=1283841 RepID=A0A084QYZ5_STAC4|nr:hypothetical protein S40285_00095 [Stachybotrys chlorohalonata IBT 40285]